MLEVRLLYTINGKNIDDRIEIVPVDLAERGKIFNETLYDKLEDVYEIIKNNVNSAYGLFGHSNEKVGIF
ncbi:hypothetical protein EV214_12619 [Marinisporobacter balticus]|uniref:Uncharacterized protein n=1 Tax=Marinisporobacter balticus TaxID=2018667 RepID=A0A4R2KIL6_9FIRM|nr:hypothetical protein EV214_12619 [Marinisporobacter balticus]